MELRRKNGSSEENEPGEVKRERYEHVTEREREREERDAIHFYFLKKLLRVCFECCEIYRDILGEIDILTILSFLVLEHGVCLHLFGPSVVFYNVNVEVLHIFLLSLSQSILDVTINITLKFLLNFLFSSCLLLL